MTPIYNALGLRTYREVPLENLKSYPVPESNFLNNTLSFASANKIVPCKETFVRNLSKNMLFVQEDLFEKKSTRNVRELRNTETDLSMSLRKTNNGQRAMSFRSWT